jgi:uncharacterized membrane protein
MTQQLIVGLLLSVLIGGLGYWRRALTGSGVVGAILVGGLVFGLGGWTWGVLLVTFFVSSSWLSHYRWRDKVQMDHGNPESAGPRQDRRIPGTRPWTSHFRKDHTRKNHRDGQGRWDRHADTHTTRPGSRRDLGQTLANGGLGAVLALVYSIYPNPLIFATFLGVMSTVNADTWATELGVLSPIAPRSITTGEEVTPGTSGGVSRLGMWASVAGALLIGAVATASVQIQSLVGSGSWNLRAVTYTLIAVCGGTAGSLFDSLLGATVQGIYFCDRCGKETESPVHHCGQSSRPLRGWGWLNNDVVNFAASAVGGLVAGLLAWVLWR